jgi:hypothetical protein
MVVKIYDRKEYDILKRAEMLLFSRVLEVGWEVWVDDSPSSQQEKRKCQRDIGPNRDSLPLLSDKRRSKFYLVFTRLDLFNM